MDIVAYFPTKSNKAMYFLLDRIWEIVYNKDKTICLSYGKTADNIKEVTMTAWTHSIGRREHDMKIRYNENVELVERIKRGLEKKGGYCPCRLEKTDDNLCMCREFREQLNDPNFEGYCHCGLFYKSNDED